MEQQNVLIAYFSLSFHSIRVSNTIPLTLRTRYTGHYACTYQGRGQIYTVISKIHHWLSILQNRAGFQECNWIVLPVAKKAECHQTTEKRRSNLLSSVALDTLASTLPNNSQIPAVIVMQHTGPLAQLICSCPTCQWQGSVLTTQSRPHFIQKVRCLHDSPRDLSDLQIRVGINTIW